MSYNIKISLFFLFFCLLSFVYSQDRIYWQEDKKLEFSDFQDTPNIRRVAALSYCGIQFYSCKYRTEPTYRVRAYFDPKKSWSWSNYRYPYVIKHEQLHFDIAELYAREIRKYFQTHPIKVQNAVEEYQKFYNKYIETQELYDSETQHGTLDKEQERWQESISEQLKNLQAYSEDVCY